jgi:hypothetical protein
MAPSLEENRKEVKANEDTTMNEDDHSEATIPRMKPPEIIEAELIEIFLRHEITIKNRESHRGSHLRHAAVLKEMYSSFSEDDLQIINNRNKRIQLPTYTKWTDEKYYKKHFDTYTIPGKGGRPSRHFVVHRIRTTLSLSTIRNERHVLQALQENDVFMKRHYFQEDEWNTVNLGFMLYFDPSKHPRDDAKERVLNMALEEGCYGDGKGDKFQLVPGTPYLYVSGRRFPTQAYTVVCLREHASDVDTMLKDTYRKTSHYVKFRLRNKNAQAFGRALQAQNHYLATLRTIPIVGLSTEMMQDLEDKFLTIEGIGDIARCNQTETIGRWNILTNEDNFHDVLKTIKQNLQSWLDETFQGIYDRPDEFPEIRVTARVADDDSSVGDCSYLSTSAISYGSFETTGSYDQATENKSSRSGRPTSYADAANNGSSKAGSSQTRNTPRNFVAVNPSSVSAMSSPSPATVPSEIHQKLQEMELKLSKFQDLEAKMDKLQKVLDALLNVTLPTQNVNEPINHQEAPATQPITDKRNEQEEAPEDPKPEEQYDPRPKAYPNALVKPTMNGLTFKIPPVKTPPTQQQLRPITLVKIQRPNIFIPAMATSPNNPVTRQHYESTGSDTGRTKSMNIGRGGSYGSKEQQNIVNDVQVAKPKQGSLGGATKLWTDPNSESDPIFDEWTVVEKKGKRTADTSNIGESKRSDQRVTPTKMKPRTKPAEPGRTRPIQSSGEYQKPHTTNKKLLFHNPYQNPKKQVNHNAVSANRQQTWKQRLNVPSSWEDDETMEYHYTSPSQSQPSQLSTPSSPQSPQRQSLAEETQPRF